MNDMIPVFKLYCRRNNITDIDDDVVNNFMWENHLYGEDIYNKLIAVKL